MSPAEAVGLRLRLRRERLAVAESCTGGLLADRLTDIPGSSDYFLLGVVAYANEAKCRLLGVDPATIVTLGAVSEQTAMAMASGVKELAQADWGLATTGVAGPTGGSVERPVGLVYVAAAGAALARVWRLQIPGGRRAVKEQAVTRLLDEFLRILDQDHGDDHDGHPAGAPLA